MSDTLWPHGLYSPLNSPGQNTGVGSLSLLQGIFLTQGSNPGLLPCRWILYHLNHRGSPRILVWGAFPFSRGSSQPRNQTWVSGIAGGFFTNWAIREAHRGSILQHNKDHRQQTRNQHRCCRSVMSNSLWPHGLYPTRLICPWGFSRQEYWSGLPFPSPGDLSNPGV